jgi:PBSX family phage terminase large subunit
MMVDPFSPKQIEFITNCTRRWNLAHGAVSTGKTVGTLFGFMHAVSECPDSDIYITGHTFDTAYRNIIRLLLDSAELALFRPFCTWSGKKLYFRDKVIGVIGAKDEGAVGSFQGMSASLVYCDEMTLYPESVIDMIDTRLRKPHSRGFAAMNPSHPNHKLKKWIDLAEAGNPHYYSQHYILDDNPYLPDDYKERIRNSATGLFYKRNVLGLWCLAEGAIFDFWDKNIYGCNHPPRSAEYWIAGIDYGTINNFACTLVGINTGRTLQAGICRWAEKEYVWDSKKMGRQKTNSEYANDVLAFLEPYGVKQVYIDPSAAAFKLELQKRGFHVIDADNDVYNGISFTTSEMQKGNLFICKDCPNLIREIESYVWDAKAAEKGEDKPLKKDDHSIDSLRYAVYSHKISTYDYQAHAKMQQEWMQNKYSVTRGYR